MYRFDTASDLAEDLATKANFHRGRQNALSALAQQYDNRNILSAHDRRIIESKVRAAGGIGHVRADARGNASAASAFETAHEMARGLAVIQEGKV